MERIPKVDVSGARVPRLSGSLIDKLPPPVTDRTAPPMIGIPRPVVELPNLQIQYPSLPLPPPDPGAGRPTVPPQEKKEEESPRKLPPPKLPVLPPPPRIVVAPPQNDLLLQPPTPPVEHQKIEIGGIKVDIPTPSEVAQASTTAVLSTSATLVTAMAFNQGRKVIGEAIGKASRRKFKIRLRSVKPVIHMIHGDDGVTVVEYSHDGVKTLATQLQNPEQFLRDAVEMDELFEATHKIVIDDPIKDMFSREGVKRFSYFANPRKLIRRLSARITL